MSVSRIFHHKCFPHTAQEDTYQRIKHECSDCNKAINNPSALRSHVRIHFKGTPLHTVRVDMKMHMRFHTGERFTTGAVTSLTQKDIYKRSHTVSLLQESFQTFNISSFIF